ncbi:MAG TPA: antibiotic biosynthesis monooxygenase family protein [Actinomycetota bacterium]|nr:antibiotic biosynthesis monooxygenase family protein [Actinomycetota bacterium]
MATSVLIHERHAVHPRHAEAYRALLSEMVSSARAAPGVLWADAAEAWDDQPSFVVLSEWRTSADADAWLASPARIRVLDRGEPWLREGTATRRFSAG